MSWTVGLSWVRQVGLVDVLVDDRRSLQPRCSLPRADVGPVDTTVSAWALGGGCWARRSIGAGIMMFASSRYRVFAFLMGGLECIEP
jgi:hypothetical protein